ncbi:MAG TPA: phage/plasmid primase, P4 family [Methanosarcina sp.]|jgi:putative DNA primase/helicase
MSTDHKLLAGCSEPEDIPFLEEWAGYCLTTDVSYQKALMLYGIPGTGKSVFVTMLETFIGEENASAESLQKIEEDKYRSAKLYGKRVNICSDIPSTKMHKTEVFKKLVSGLDTVDAENKFQDPFKFKNKAKLTFSANKIPEGPKDPAFYERFCLVEFEHKFRGTEDDDKNLIQKLTTDIELSGFLNVALKGLKRLYDNDKFSYNKTFEETEREYMLNSNPVAFFMEECTMISSKDIEGTLLYLSYVDWCNKSNKTRVSNIEFSRQLNKMGYTSHRDNVIKDGSKKVTVWDNLQLKLSEKNDNPHEPEEKKCDFGQDLGQDLDGRSCPKISSPPITESSFKNAFGQDLNPYVGFAAKINQNDCENIETVKGVKNEEIKNTPNMLKRSCPSVCFFDSGEYGQDVSKHPVLDPVREQKTLVFEQNEEENSTKILSGCDLMRTDLKNFAKSKFHLIVDNIPVFVGEFNKKYPGYKQTYGLQAVLDNAERLSSRGWK